MTKRAAKGTLIQYQTAVGPPAVYTSIPGLGDFNVPLGEKDDIDVTTHDSPGGYEETVPGIGRLPAWSVPAMWDGANTVHKALLTAHDADTQMILRVTCVDGQTVDGLAYVKNVTLNAPVNGKYDASVSFKWASKPVVTAPA